jgi:hypothetical protein
MILERLGAALIPLSKEGRFPPQKKAPKMTADFPKSLGIIDSAIDPDRAAIAIARKAADAVIEVLGTTNLDPANSDALMKWRAEIYSRTHAAKLA